MGVPMADFPHEYVGARVRPLMGEHSYRVVDVSLSVVVVMGPGKSKTTREISLGDFRYGWEPYPVARAQ